MRKIMNGDNNFEAIDCLICGNSNLSNFPAANIHLNLSNPIKTKRCKNCSFLFLSPRPNEEVRNIIFKNGSVKGLEEYLSKPPEYGEVTESRRKTFRDRVFYITSNYLNNKGKVLDIGASSGVFMEEANNQGWDCYGIEPSKEGSEQLIKKGLNAKQSLAESLPYDDNTFDWIHSNHVFEHLANPLAAGREAYRVCKPGGLIYIEVPNQFDNIQFFRYRMMNQVPIRERNIRSIHHLSFFSKKTLHLLLQKAGFKSIIISDYYGSKRRGVGSIGSTLVRFIGNFYLGGPFIQAIGRK